MLGVFSFSVQKNKNKTLTLLLQENLPLKVTFANRSYFPFRCVTLTNLTSKDISIFVENKLIIIILRH